MNNQEHTNNMHRAREVRTQEQAKYYPRHPLAASLLSLLLPDLGQMHNGQLKKRAEYFTFCCFDNEPPRQGSV